MQEDRKSTSSHFLTLTYDGNKTDTEGNSVPLRTSNGFTTVSKRHVQLFIKRLRALPVNREKRIKYYCAAEYGSRTARPHYHLLIFNSNADAQAYSDAWQMGNVYLGDVREASVGYTLKYISKGKTVPRHKNDDRLPEFSLQSTRLGAAYLTPAVIAWHQEDPVDRCYTVIPGGKKISLARYYKDRIFSEQDRKEIADFFKEKYKEENQHPEDHQVRKTRIEGDYARTIHQAKDPHGKEMF